MTRETSPAQRAPSGGGPPEGEPGHRAPLAADPHLGAGETPGGIWSYPPGRILVPVDFGDASARALAVAGALARRYDSQLTVLHADILEAPIYFTHEQTATIERERLAARAAAEDELMRFARHVTSEPALIRFVDPPPAAAILEASRAADLIVMGTHGRRGPSRWWLGSIAERTVRESAVPVLVLRAAQAAEPADSAFRRPLMVGAGPRTFDDEAARYGAGLAETFHGAMAEQAASCEEDLVREREATLLVVARDPAGAGWIGTSAERLIRSCRLPMLFVPHKS